MPRCSVLASPVMTPALEQLDQPVGEHLGVDAEVALVLEVEQHARRGSRRCPSAAWRRPRSGRRCCGRSPWPPRRPRPPCGSSSTGAVDLHHVGEAGDVDEGVPERARHLLVDQRDHRARRARPPPSCSSTPTPKEQKPCSSGGEMWISATSTGDVPVVDQPRDLRQVHRHEVGAPLVDGLAHVGAGEQGPVAERSRRTRVGVAPRCRRSGCARPRRSPARRRAPTIARDQLLGVVAAAVDPDVVARRDRLRRPPRPW